MEVILLEKVRNLGSLGSQVKVKAGYARNFLIPYGKAVLANEKNKEEFESRREELEKAQHDLLAMATTRAKKLEGSTVEIASRASEEGKLFGSVNIRDVAKAITDQGNEVSSAEVILSTGAIKEIGTHTVTLSLHPEVTIQIQLSVVAEK